MPIYIKIHTQKLTFYLIYRSELRSLERSYSTTEPFAFIEAFFGDFS